MDKSKCAKNTDLGNLKSDVDDFGINKFKNISADLSKRSNVSKNDVVKMTVYDELVLKRLMLFKLLILLI